MELQKEYECAQEDLRQRREAAANSLASLAAAARRQHSHIAEDDDSSSMVTSTVVLEKEECEAVKCGSCGKGLGGIAAWKAMKGDWAMHCGNTTGNYNIWTLSFSGQRPVFVLICLFLPLKCYLDKPCPDNFSFGQHKKFQIWTKTGQCLDNFFCQFRS